MMELSKKITDILEKHEFSECGEITERYKEFNQYDIDLEIYSPAGEDVIVSLVFDGTDEDFIREFKRYANDFDPDEHAEMWIDHRGKNGVPNSIRDLLDDANWIKSKLEEVADDLENIDNGFVLEEVIMDTKQIASILYDMSLGLDYADGIEYAEEEIDTIEDEILFMKENKCDSLLHVLENIALKEQQTAHFKRGFEYEEN